MKIELGKYYRCLKTVREQNIRAGQVWRYDKTSPDSSMGPMLIKDPANGKGKSTMLINGSWLLRQPGWFEPVDSQNDKVRDAGGQ